jgi:hypothetical protein
MPQCTHSSFSRTVAAALMLAATLLGSSTAHAQANAVAAPVADQQVGQGQPSELDGQIDKTVKTIRRRFDALKANEPSLAAKENRGPKSDADLAKEAAKVTLDTRQALSLYATTMATNDPTIRSSAKQATNSVKSEADEARVDKQVGSNSSSSGSTSLTSHGSVPAVLAFAVENGAIERTVSGSSITFRARPVQVVQALQTTPFYDAYAQIQNNGTLDLLNRLSFALSFDTSRGNSSGTFTGTSNQVSEFSTTVDLYNHRDPRDKRYKALWDRLQLDIAKNMALSLYNLFDALTAESVRDDVGTWVDQTASALAPLIVDGKDEEAAATLKETLKSFPTIAEKVAGGDVIIKQFATTSAAMQTARQNIFTYVSNSPILTFEYTDNLASKVSSSTALLTNKVAAQAGSSGTQLPDTSNLKLIFERGIGGGGSFASNLSATIFNSKPPAVGTNQLRDLQASLQLDIPVNTSLPKIGNVVVSLSGKFEHIPSDSLVGLVPGITPITSDAALKGNLEIGQAKITFPVKGSGVKIPLSFTWANRTELIKEKEVRGNIGITFDFDTILSKLKP